MLVCCFPACVHTIWLLCALALSQSLETEIPNIQFFFLTPLSLSGWSIFARDISWFNSRWYIAFVTYFDFTAATGVFVPEDDEVESQGKANNALTFNLWAFKEGLLFHFCKLLFFIFSLMFHNVVWQFKLIRHYAEMAFPLSLIHMFLNSMQTRFERPVSYYWASDP